MPLQGARIIARTHSSGQAIGVVRIAGYGEEIAEPQIPPVALTRAIALRDCALRYEPPPRGAASASLTDASPVAAALLIGCMDTRIEPADPVRASAVPRFGR